MKRNGRMALASLCGWVYSIFPLLKSKGSLPIASFHEWHKQVSIGFSYTDSIAFRTSRRQVCEMLRSWISKNLKSTFAASIIVTLKVGHCNSFWASIGASWMLFIKIPATRFCKCWRLTSRDYAQLLKTEKQYPKWGWKYLLIRKEHRCRKFIFIFQKTLRAGALSFNRFKLCIPSEEIAKLDRKILNAVDKFKRRIIHHKKDNLEFFDLFKTRWTQLPWPYSQLNQIKFLALNSFFQTFCQTAVKRCRTISKAATEIEMLV